MLTVTVSLLLFVVLSVYLYCKQKFKYWEKKGVASLNPFTPAGDVFLSLIGCRNLHFLLHDHYNEFKKRGFKYGDMYFMLGPIFFPVDAELIKRVLQTDFEYFHDRGLYHNQKEQPLSENLFAMDGEKWKTLRQKLTPIFTPGKLKAMLPALTKHSKDLVDVIKKSEGSAVNVSDLCTRYAIDTTVDSLFGIQESSLNKNKSVYMDVADKISNCPFTSLLKVAWSEGTSNPGNLMKAAFSDEKLYPIFKTIVTDIISHREENKVRRNDLINFLLAIVKDDRTTENNPLHSFNINDVIAQVLTFFAAGFEPTTIVLSCCMYELAKHSHLQEKLRDEIMAALNENDNEISLSTIENMKYLDHVIAEAVRLHPVAAELNRICVKDYKLPGTEITIEKGTPVLISVLGLHQDPGHFPRPEKFDPDRFADKDNAPYSIGFGAGPRYCIAKRFAEIVMKLAIINIMSTFELTVNKKTGPKLQVGNLTRHLTLQYDNQIWINFDPLH